MAKLNNTDGFTLHGWMVKELHLTGGDLFTYALINQFSQSEAGIYKGGVPYLCQWTGWSQNTARKYLRNLEHAGLIKPERGNINGVPFCYYKTINTPTLQNLKDTPQNLKDDPSKIEVPTLQNLSGDNNNRKVKGNNKMAQFVKPTIEEVAEYVRKRGFADPEGFAAFYVETNDNRDWITGKGERVRNWKNNIIQNWEDKFINRTFQKHDTDKSFTPKNTFYK